MPENTRKNTRPAATVATALCIALLITGLAGCGSSTFTHGNRLDPLQLEQVRPGVTRLSEVEALFGRPSVDGAFNSGTVYYIAQIMEAAPAGRKETASRTIVAFSYDDAGIITAINITDETSGRTVAHITDKTPIPGDNFGVVDQIFGNIQRGPGGIAAPN